MSEIKESLNRCPGCGGAADNGHDRCLPPNPYFCTKCMGREYPAEGAVKESPSTLIQDMQDTINKLTKKNINLRVQIIGLQKAHAKKDSKLHKTKKKLKGVKAL